MTAVYEQGESSPSNFITLNGTVATPEFSIDPGEYKEVIFLSITTATSQTTIYYSLDDTIPDENSAVFTPDEPIAIHSTTTVKAVAVREGWIDSDILEGTFVSLSIDEDGSVAYETRLLNAYPNPFNPETIIEFTLKESDNVSIAIYNVLGQRVNLLCDNRYEAGRHRIVWQGDDDEGIRLSSGVYFYRMQTSEYSRTNKLLMLK